MLIILARPTDYGLIASAVVNEGITKNSNQSPIYRAITKFSKTTFSIYYSDTTVPAEMKNQVAVFIVVNPNGAIKEALENLAYGNNTWAQTIGNVTEGYGAEVRGSIWDDNKFLMSNQLICIRNIPSSVEGWNPYSDGNNFFYLSDINGVAGAVTSIDNSANTGKGAIKVERVAARFDFRDGSAKGDNTYNVMYLRNDDGTVNKNAPYVAIKLNKMGLTNMSNSYYIFGRVSNNGQNSVTYDQTNNENQWLLCGAEKPWYSDATGTEIAGGNYVVSTYATEKAAGISTAFTTYFNYPFFSDDQTVDNSNIQGDGRWYVSKISDILKSNTDNWTGSESNRYHVWRYVTENTIPGIDNQTYGHSTIIVFKGKMIGDKSKLTDPETIEDKTSVEYFDAKSRWDLVATLNNESADFGDSNTAPILYAYNGILYTGWQTIREAAINASLTITFNADKTEYTYSWDRDNSIYKAVFGTGVTGEKINVEYYNPAAEDGSQTVNVGTIDDTGDEDETSPNYLWNAWNATKKEDNDALKKFKAAATSEKSMITIYQRSQDTEGGWGYYCYYYYKNRHH